MDASLYRTNVRNEIFFISSPGALLSGYFTNLARTRREGVETSVQGVALDGRADWYANYEYTHATFQSPATIFSIRSDADVAGSPLAGENAVHPGDELPLVPAHQANAGVGLRVTRALSLGVDARYIGRQWLRGDESNTAQPLDPYALVNVRASVAQRGWTIAANVDNLANSTRAVFGTFNENRQTNRLERSLTPLNARSFRIPLRRSFGASPPEE